MARDLALVEVLDAVHAGLIVLDTAKTIVHWNAWMAAASGIPAAAACGRSLGQVFPDTPLELIERGIGAALQTGASTLLTHGLHPYLLPLRTRGNAPMMHDVAASTAGHGTDRRCVLHIMDVTSAASREKFLWDRQNARYDALVRSAFDPIITMDSDGVIRLANQAAVTQLGYAEPEINGRPAVSLFEPARTWNGLWESVMASHSVHPVELAGTRKDGVIRHFEVTASKWQDGTRVFVTAILRDITQRREADAALRHSEALSRQNARAMAELNEILKQSGEALNEAALRKDQFLATLAHELRNPLAPLRNGLSLIRIAGADPATVETTREMMERQLAHMVRLIDDLMDVSRINRDMIELTREPLPLARVIDQAVESCRPLLEKQQHSLSLDVPEEPIVVNGDFVRLVQVIVNLLTNAIKYTPRGGNIRIVATRDARRAAIVIKDTGIGIPAHMLSKIFDLFMQVDHSIERSQGGLGIGLSLVKRLVEMHGGVVTARSKGPDDGSEFTVQLPLAAQAAVRDQDGKEDAFAELMPGRRILVADDNEDSANSLALILRSLGHDARTAHDGVAAMELGEAFHPEIALLDIGMPRLNGYDTARLMRKAPWGSSLFMVALTGWGQPADRRHSSEAGFDAHLVKPVDTVALTRLLRTAQGQT